jgi:hypothetical protein
LNKNAVDDECGDAAESRTESTLGLEVLNGCAEVGGDGLWLHEEELGFNGFIIVIEGRIGVRGRDGFEDDGFWGFDHQEGGDQMTEGVGDLEWNVSGCVVSRVLWDLPWTKQQRIRGR